MPHTTHDQVGRPGADHRFLTLDAAATPGQRTAQLVDILNWVNRVPEDDLELVVDLARSFPVIKAKDRSGNFPFPDRETSRHHGDLMERIGLRDRHIAKVAIGGTKPDRSAPLPAHRIVGDAIRAVLLQPHLADMAELVELTWRYELLRHLHTLAGTAGPMDQVAVEGLLTSLGFEEMARLCVTGAVQDAITALSLT